MCYNRPLADRLQSIAGEHVSVDTFHGFCTQVAERAGINLEYGKENFWASLLDEIYAITVADEDKYDCLIVDEGHRRQGGVSSHHNFA